MGPGRRRRRGVRPRTATAPRPSARSASGSPATRPTGSRFYERKYAALVGRDRPARAPARRGRPARRTRPWRSIGKLRDQVDEPHCVGDLAALRARLDGLVAAVDAQRAARKAEREAARARAGARPARGPGRPRPRRSPRARSGRHPATGSGRSSRSGARHRTPSAPTSRSSGSGSATRAAPSRSDAAPGSPHATPSAPRRSRSRRRSSRRPRRWRPARTGGPTSAAFRTLMQRWKAAGPATREAEQELWTRFKAAQDTFFAARSAVFDERDAEQQQNLARPSRQLADEAETLLPVEDLAAARAALRSHPGPLGRRSATCRAPTSRPIETPAAAGRAGGARGRGDPLEAYQPRGPRPGRGDRRAAHRVDRQAREAARCG